MEIKYTYIYETEQGDISRFIENEKREDALLSEKMQRNGKPYRLTGILVSVERHEVF